MECGPCTEAPFEAAVEIVAGPVGKQTLVESSVNENDLAWTILIDLQSFSIEVYVWNGFLPIE